jgi:hypothetical protein
MSYDENMNAAILKNLPTIPEIQPHESTLLVRINPAALSNDCLQALRLATEPQGTVGDELRAWLRERVLRESGRRLDDSTDTPMEAEAWCMPWHRWNDDELRGALAARFAWAAMRTSEEIDRAFGELHAAVVTVCCCRLGELHAAIERSQRN